MKWPKTVEEARALPEIESAFRDSYTVVEDGVSVVYDRVRPFYASDVSGDSIIAFVDADGRSMRVVGTENGPAKTEFRL